MTEKIVLVGTNLFAEVVYAYFSEASDFEVVGFCESKAYLEQRDSREFLGLEVVSFENVESRFPPHATKMFVAIGYARLNHVRAKFYEEAKSKGYELVSYIYPGVRLWSTNKIGDNTFIFENNTLQPFAQIGNNVVLWSGNHIGHHSKIGDHTFITSHVVISGNCTVGEICMIGVNATLRDSIEIGDECLIGAGSLIMKSAGPRELFISERTCPRKETTAKYFE